MAFCTHCGAENAPGATFCTKCGQPMGAAPQPAAQPAQAQPQTAQPSYQPQGYAAPAPAAPKAPRQPLKLELMSLVSGGLLILGGLTGFIVTCCMNPFYVLVDSFSLLNNYGLGNAIGGFSVWAAIALILVWLVPIVYGTGELINGLLFHKKSRLPATLMQIGNYANLLILADAFLASLGYLISVIVFMASYSNYLDGSPLPSMLIHNIITLLLTGVLTLLCLTYLRAQKQAIVSFHQHQMGYAAYAMDQKLKILPLVLGGASLVFGILSFFFCGFTDLDIGYAVAAFIMSLFLAGGYFFGFLSFQRISAQVAGQKAPDYKAAFDKMRQESANKYVPSAQSQNPTQGFIRTAQGVRYPVNAQEIRLGYDPAQAGIQFTDPTGRISPLHCGLRFEQGQYVVTDYSTTGTVVNGMRLTQGQPTYALPGSTVVLGESITITLE